MPSPLYSCRVHRRLQPTNALLRITLATPRLLGNAGGRPRALASGAAAAHGDRLNLLRTSPILSASSAPSSGQAALSSKQQPLPPKPSATPAVKWGRQVTKTAASPQLASPRGPRGGGKGQPEGDDEEEGSEESSSSSSWGFTDLSPLSYRWGGPDSALHGMRPHA